MYKDITDNELIYLVRCNNIEARDYLIERYKKRIYGIIAKFKRQYDLKRLDFEEYYQKLSLVFLRCFELFEEGYNFYSYIEDACINKLLKALKVEKRKEPLSVEYDLNDADYYELSNVNEEKETYNSKELMDYLNDSLTSEEMKIIKYKLEGYKTSEIIHLLSMSNKMYYRRMNRIKKVIREKL